MDTLFVRLRSFADEASRSHEDHPIVSASPVATPKVPAANRDRRKPVREPALAQIASFVDLFVWLLVLKSFFLPLFIIPTGSMAATLSGAHADHACPNCGFGYTVGFDEVMGPVVVECPNCRFQQPTAKLRGVSNPVTLREKSGDRIVVLGWPYVLNGWMGLGPRRWDAVVFKNPNDQNMNFIKRLIGLPGETIEIIDGDIWVTPPGSAEPRLAVKTRTAQDALWISYYDHNHRPREAAKNNVPSRGPWQPPDMTWDFYHPRWSARTADAPWRDLETRRIRFDGAASPRGEIQFVSGAEGAGEPGQIADTLGYNGSRLYPQGTIEPRVVHLVTDVRLAATVEFEKGDGSVELSVSKYFDEFFATLHADGRLTLEHSKRASDAATPRESWGEVRVASLRRPVTLSIGHADGLVTVEVDGRSLLQSDSQRYSISAAEARQRQALRRSPTVRIAAERVVVALSDLRIDRDVHYTCEAPALGAPQMTNAVEGRPLKLRDDAYFVLGDNSTRSHDGRHWKPPARSAAEMEQQQSYLGPHLWSRYKEGAYAPGTVPADQMIGRAFLVYWPGCLPNPSWVPRGVPNLIPDFGRVRWIH